MGSYSSSFVTDSADQFVNTGTHPSKANWITSHAVITGLTIVEVERLWCRFQQLGCNEDGVLEMEVMNRPPASNDIFAKNILLSFVGNAQLIDFRTFLNAMMWAERAALSDKIRAAFNLLNSGNPVPKTVLHAVLRKTYPEKTEQEVRTLTDTIMGQVDTERTGLMTVDQFYRWVTKSRSDISEILDFRIVPSELTADTSSSDHPTIPSDSLLVEVARKVYTRDWHLLANKLGLLISEVTPFETMYSTDVPKQVFEMLKLWRSHGGMSANNDKLELALQQAGMTDVALLIFQ